MNALNISANTSKITKNKNDIVAVKVLATSAVTTTLLITRGIQKGKKSRKAGDGKYDIVVLVIVQKTGKFLVSFCVIIQLNGMNISGFNYSSWYDTANIPTGNHKLTTTLRKESSIISGTEIITDGGTYAKSLQHDIFNITDKR